MQSLMLSLLIIFSIISLIPLFSKKIRIPVIIIELLIGIILGKSLLNIIPQHQTIEFFASFGLTYLMFIAGIEVDFREVMKNFSKTLSIALFSIIVPFISGAMLGFYINVSPLLIGTIFSTTSLGLVLPLTKSLKNRPKIKHILLGSVILIDIISMFILALSLTILQGSLGFSFLYSFLAILTLFLIPLLINKKGLQKKIENWMMEKSHFDMEMRFSFALIFLLALVAEHLGFHSIIGAFIAGLIISELTPKASIIEDKLISFGYGFFVPLFFILIGAKVNLPLIFSDLSNLFLLAIIIVIGIFSKVIGVTFISWFEGFSFTDSLGMGFIHSARLSLIIAAVEIGRRAGFIDLNLFSIFVVLAIVSAIIGPSIGKILLDKRKIKSML
ncbi:cation:proton antiporter [Candidatus Woesearchaeota archaeon]|jgi:monovalent cation:H+ antiporter-2, CPA2 family|nr:cation:proton antiporter [Candidatus Woesearchaeota archaeon]MBT6519980.1 cation:proton antiporter [Candidatus Woesearchaeota archaeon]MBT7367819.1 cation:proton antiporter [Candidatus Woesearchaeota archaeon]